MINYKSFVEGIPDRGYWDYEILKYILPSSTPNNGSIVIIPARSHANSFEAINKYIAQFGWCILFLMGDEENVFPINKIKHSNIRIYQQTPHQPSDNVDRYIPNGVSPHVNFLKKTAQEQKYRWSFAGQVTHKRRRQIGYILDKLEGGEYHPTQGFTQGLGGKDYMRLIQLSKVVVCPSGTVIPDTFRLYEALEGGSLPIVDKSNYWDLIFENFPVPQIDKPEELEGTINYHNDTYPSRLNECMAWWIKYKIDLRDKVRSDVSELSGGDIEELGEDISIIIPTSPISLHPDTSIIDETINSIRTRFRTERIYIMFDGVRDEQKEYQQRYMEYIRRLLYKMNMDGNMYPIYNKEHRHQVAMTRQALDVVTTDNILFVEHDTPLCEDIPIPKILEILKSGKANVVRLNHEALILPEHDTLYIDKVGEFRRTIQWSQRPHFAKTRFYKKILNKYFTTNARCMIEDGIHGHVSGEYQRLGKAALNDWRIYTYCPDGDQKRSYTTDGRGKDPKYDSTFIY